MLRLSTLDDRGRPARVLPLPAWPRDARPPSLSLRPVLHALLTALRSRAVWSLALIAFVLSALAIGFRWMGPVTGFLLIFSPVISLLLAVAALAAVSLAAAFSRHRQRVIRAWLAAHRCPSCRYSLFGLEPDPYGLLVCPECAAAWNLSRLHPPRRIVVAPVAPAELS